MQNKSAPVSRKQTLYRVHVETTEGQMLAVGPAMLKEACEQFAHTIKQQIAAGKERTWSNPTVTQVLNLH